MKTSGPNVHKRKYKEDPSYEKPNGVRGPRMVKRGRRDTNKDADARDLIEEVIMFMGIGGK